MSKERQSKGQGKGNIVCESSYNGPQCRTRSERMPIAVPLTHMHAYVQAVTKISEEWCNQKSRLPAKTVSDVVRVGQCQDDWLSFVAL